MNLPGNISRENYRLYSVVYYKCDGSYVARITHQVVHESGALDAQGLDGLEHVHNLLSLHAVHNVIQRAECSRSAETIATADRWGGGREEKGRRKGGPEGEGWRLW